MQDRQENALQESQEPEAFERVLDARLIMSVVAAGIMSFSGVVVETAMNVTFPDLMREFNIDTSTVQWMTTAYLLVLAAIIPTSSYLNKRFKTKHIFIVAMVFYILGIVLGLTSQNFPWLLCGRISEGIGTGIALPLMFNIIQEQAPRSHMGLMMGVGSFVTAMAPAVGPSVGGWLAETFGWRSIFACLLPLLAIAFVIGSLSIRQSHKTQKGHFDALGWVLLVAAFTSLVFATSNMGELGVTNPLILGLIAACVVLIALFAWHASHTADPLISLYPFGSYHFNFGLLAIVCFQFIVLSLSYLLPNYSQLVMGHGSTEAGFILLPGCLLGAALSPISGRILDSFGARKPIFAGISCALVSAILFWATADYCTTIVATLIYMVFTLGQGLTVGNTMTSALAALPTDHKADGTAIINTLQQLAGALGTSVVTAIVDAAQTAAGVSTSEAGEALAAATATGTRTAFGLLIVMAAMALASEVIALHGTEKPTVREPKSKAQSACGQPHHC